MRLYYYLNKENWNVYERRKRKRKTKGQKEFREKRAKCIWYLVRVNEWSYRKAAERFSICDPKNVWKILRTYERKLNEEKERNRQSSFSLRR